MTAPAAIDEVLIVDGLRMSYGSVDVLDEVTFRACRGEVLAVLGPNGAGKTTTIEILEGFRRRSAGKVSVLGADPEAGDEQWRARMGIVLQSWRDHGKWRVREFLAYQASYYRAYASPRTPRPWDGDALLAAADLTGQANSQLRLLSGGQRRRLDLAVGLVGRPELLFLDEPTAGLDPQARREFHLLVGQVARDLATTILLTTHDLDEADKLVDRIIILAGGRVIADGTAAQLADQIAGKDLVHWVRAGQHFTQSTVDSTAFVRELFARHGKAITELEVRRASLEDTYLTLVRQGETAGNDAAVDDAAVDRVGAA